MGRNKMLLYIREAVQGCSEELGSRLGLAVGLVLHSRSRKRFSTRWGTLVPLWSWALAHEPGMAVSRSLFVPVVLLLPWRTEGPGGVESFNFFEF